MNEKLIEELDQCWDYDNGFFGQLKQRVFDRKLFEKVISILQDVHFEEEQEDIPRRLVSLLWYIPLFMEWNAEGVSNQIPKDEYNNCKTPFIGGWQFTADASVATALRSTKSIDLLSFKNGYGPFGQQGLKIGNYRIDMLYKNPASGLGHGTLFSLKQMKKGGNLFRWDYGTLHSGGAGWHSTFRLTIRGTQYGSSAQRHWAAPFMFFKYKKP